jgi:hypothetical protein
MVFCTKELDFHNLEYELKKTDEHAEHSRSNQTSQTTCPTFIPLRQVQHVHYQNTVLTISCLGQGLDRALS